LFATAQQKVEATELYTLAGYAPLDSESPNLPANVACMEDENIIVALFWYFF